MPDPLEKMLEYKRLYAILLDSNNICRVCAEQHGDAIRPRAEWREGRCDICYNKTHVASILDCCDICDSLKEIGSVVQQYENEIRSKQSAE